MQTNQQPQSKLARGFLLALAIIAVTTFATPQVSSASDIVIFRKTESTKYLSYHNAYEAFGAMGGVTEVPGGRSKYSLKRRSYIVMNTKTGEYREVRYYTYRERNVITNRLQTIRSFDYDFADRALKDLFETGAEERRNYLVLSFQGTGMGDNYTADSTGDPYYRTAIETLAGIIKLQKFKTHAGVVECFSPSRLSGSHGIEQREEFQNGTEKDRSYGTGKVSLVLDKKRTRTLLEAERVNLAGGVNFVIEFLNSKGYYESF